MRRTQIIVGTLFIAMLLVLGACAPTATPRTTPAPSVPVSPAPEVSQPAPTNVIKMTIYELLDTMSILSGQKGNYNDKVIQTVGEVKTKQSTQKGYVITFTTAFEQLNVTFGKEPSSVKIGERIAVRGQWAGGSHQSGYDLINCALVPALKVTAEDFYADFQTNAIATELKYKTEIVRIRGEVSQIQRNPLFGQIEVWLVGDKAGGSVRLLFGSEWESNIAGFKVGQIIEAKGEFDTLFGSSRAIPTLSECSLVE